jgi:hypothetical protein
MPKFVSIACSAALDLAATRCRKLSIRFLKALVPILLLVPISAAADPNYIIETNPASTENMWETSSFVGGPIISTYVPTLSEFE